MSISDTPIALITGGSRGLGRSAALYLARHGADLILTYRQERQAAEAVKAEIEALGRRAEILPLDIGHTATIPAFATAVRERLASVWQREHIDFLVNNAGHGVFKRIEETTEAEFDSLVDVHLKGVFFLTQALLSVLADGGRILNISSGLARFPLPGYAAYAVMKGGVEVFTRYLAAELGARGIAVNTLAPGAVETDFGGGAVRDNAELNAHIAAATAMGRVGRPEDIGGAISAVLMGETGWMTGQRIEVSGGQNL